VVLLDEEEEEDLDEDLDEEDLDIGTEIDPDSPPWDMYCEPELDDNDDSNEDTALLRSKAARTEIIVTPISPVNILRFLLHNFIPNALTFVINVQVSSSNDIVRMGQVDLNRTNGNGSSSSSNRMDLLKPDMQPQRIISEDI
jgi:hypothetical protein